MTSKIAQVKNVIMDLLADGEEHTSKELQKVIADSDINVEENSGILRTAIYQLRNNGVDIYSKDRGIYQIRKQRNKEIGLILNDFITIIPEKKVSPFFLYVHEDGYIVMNGRLNAEIETREIELRVSNDGKRIALIPNGINNHKFTKSGRTKNNELLKILKNKHVGVPASFLLEKDSLTNIWIGEICKMSKKSRSQSDL